MDEFSERLGKWKIGFFEDFRKRWWWALIIAPLGGFIWALIADRFIGAANRYIDTHVSIEAVRPIVSAASILSLRPVVMAILASLVVFLGLVIHAYWETRGGREAIDCEVYRIVATPKSAVYELYADALKVTGNPDGAVIDADVLVEMYIVNQSTKSLYIRDVLASVEIDGTRTPLERKNDFYAFEFSGRDYEYVTERPDGRKDSLIDLSSRMNKMVPPGEPLEGWARFEIKNILFWKLENNKTHQFTIVDSRGRRYPVTKASTLKRDGKITVRPR